MKLFILASIIAFSMIGVVGIQNAESTQCAPSFVRIEEFVVGDKDTPQWGSTNDSKYNLEYEIDIQNDNIFEIGKDTIKISGKMVNLHDKFQTINLGILSNERGNFTGFICSVPYDVTETLGNDGEHFEIISESSKTITLQPNEIITFEMELKPLVSGVFKIHPITQHSPAHDQTHPYFGLSPNYDRVWITDNNSSGFTVGNVTSKITSGQTIDEKLASVPTCEDSSEKFPNSALTDEQKTIKLFYQSDLVVTGQVVDKTAYSSNEKNWDVLRVQVENIINPNPNFSSNVEHPIILVSSKCWSYSGILQNDLFFDVGDDVYLYLNRIHDVRFTVSNPIKDMTVDSSIASIPSPLVQNKAIRSGIWHDDWSNVYCKPSLVPITKPNAEFACVTPETKTTLNYRWYTLVPALYGDPFTLPLGHKINSNYDPLSLPYGLYTQQIFKAIRHPPPMELYNYGNSFDIFVEANGKIDFMSSSYANQPYYTALETLQEEDLKNKGLLRIPSIIPEGLELQKSYYRSSPISDSGTVSLFLIPTTINTNQTTTFESVLDFNGIIILTSLKSNEWTNEELEIWRNNMINQTNGKSEKIEIHNWKGLMNNGEPQEGISSNITLVSDNITVQLISSAYDVSYLTEIATSLIVENRG
jgi:hypothetical protein